MQALATGIYNKLVADNGAGGVHTLVTGRIYDMQAPQDALMPLVLHSIVDNPPWTTFTKNHLRAEFQIDVFALTQAGAAVARAVADRLYVLLHLASLTVSGFSGVEMLCLDRGTAFVDDDAIHIVTRWRVTGTVNA